MITASQGTMKRHSRPLSRCVHLAHRTSPEAVLGGFAFQSTPEEEERREIYLTNSFLSPISLTHFLPHLPSFNPSCHNDVSRPINDGYWGFGY